jgi:hypothetical protein
MDIPESAIAVVASAGVVLCGAISALFLWTRGQLNARISALEAALKAESIERRALEKFIRGEHQELLVAAHDREQQHDRWMRRLARLAEVPPDPDTDMTPALQRHRTPRPHTAMEHG